MVTHDPTPSNPEEINDTELIEALNLIANDFDDYIDLIKSLSADRSTTLRELRIPVCSSVEVQLPRDVCIEDGETKVTLEANYRRGRVALGTVAIKSMDVMPLIYREIAPGQAYFFMDPRDEESGFVSRQRVRGFVSGLIPGKKTPTWDELEAARQEAVSSDASYNYQGSTEDGSLIEAKVAEVRTETGDTTLLSFKIMRPEIGGLTEGTSFTIFKSSVQQKPKAGVDLIELEADVSANLGWQAGVVETLKFNIEPIDTEESTRLPYTKVTRTQLTDIIEVADFFSNQPV